MILKHFKQLDNNITIIDINLCFWVASTDATHIFVWIWGSNMAAFPVMVPDFFIL